ncbi:MAG: hypothetical protein R3Y13_05430 [bacterium]
MNIIEKLNEEDYLDFRLSYCKNDEWTTNQQVSIIMSKSDLILSYFKNDEIIVINDLDRYLDYIFILTIESIDESIIKEEYKAEFNIISKLLKKVELEKSSLTKFLISNYKSIFEIDDDKICNKPDIIEITIKLLIKFNIKEYSIIEYLIYNFPNKILSNYSDFDEIFKNKKGYYELILSETELKKYFFLHSLKYGKIFSKLSNIDKIMYRKKIELCISLVKNKSEEFDNDNIIYYFKYLIDFVQMLKDLSDPNYNIMLKYQKLKQIEFDNYILKNGQKMEFNIGVIKKNKNKELGFDEKMLLLTHVRNEDKMISVINNLHRNNVECLSDILSYNFETTDEIFTKSFKRNLEISLTYYVNLLGILIYKEEKIEEIIGYIKSKFLEYLKESGNEEEVEKIEFDFDL